MGKRKGEVVLTFKKSGFLFENIEKQRSKERPEKLEMFVHTQARPQKDYGYSSLPDIGLVHLIIF